MKRKMKARVAALIIAGIMLTGALAVSAVNGSPYETLKNAVINAMLYDNVTMNATIKMSVNGMVIENQRAHIIQTPQARLQLFYDRWTGEPNGDFAFTSQNMDVRRVNLGGEGQQWYSANLHAGRWWRNQTLSGMTADNANSAMFRFMEVLFDLAIGNLKNNFSMSQSGGIRTVTATFNHSQLPELMRVGLDAVIEANQNSFAELFVEEMPQEAVAQFYYHRRILESLFFDRIHVRGEIDGNGNLVGIYGNLIVSVTYTDGSVEIMELDISMIFSDIGTSVPFIPIEGAYEILTHDFAQENFGRRYMWLYFLRLEDGSIDFENIQSTFPVRERVRDFLR